jgi:hypothetical protein
MTKLAACIFLFVFIAAFHSDIYAYIIVLRTAYDGNAVLENEGNVALYLERIIRNYGDYSIRAFNRKAISYKVRKTAGLTHRFYVISMTDGTYHTLSFSATNKWAVSKGAWAMDTESDIVSYRDYIQGNNVWDVEEITTDNGINTLLTVENVLSKLRSNTTYYFRSRVNKNDRHDNCSTALLETLVENESESSIVRK